jgi:hypothetical protein
MLGMPLNNLFRLGQDYGCLNLIAFKRGEPVVRGCEKGVLIRLSERCSSNKKGGRIIDPTAW